MATGMTTEQPDAPQEPRARLDVLAFPSPTTARYVVFAVAMLASGLFVGNYVHGMTMGDSWTRTVAVCMGRYGGSGSVASGLAQQPAFVDCTADAERTRVAVTVAGAAAVAVAGAVLMFVVPVVVQRRRRLRPVPDALHGASQRFSELADRAGAAGRVLPLLGPASQRDAFSFGAPGRYLTALPPAVAVRYRDMASFDPVVSHELAHVAHHDVTLAWLTRLVWWTLAPLLFLPVVVGLVQGDLSLMRSYWWRAALLGLAVALLSSQLLRTREYGADLRAARLGGAVEPLVAVLRRSSAPEAATRPPLRRVFAKHPTTGERIWVLEEPVRVTGTGFADGLAGAFLSALALPLLVSTTSPLFALAGRADLAYAAAAILLGPLLAGAVGMGVWRAVLYARTPGGSAPPTGVALGVGVGVLLGQAVSLQQAGLGTLTGSSRPAWLLVSGLLAAGAVALTSGLAHLWSDLSPRLRSARASWLPSLFLCSAVFASMLWSSTLFQTAVDLGGWPLARATLPGLLSPWLMVALVAFLALAAAAALVARPRGPRTVPGWLSEDSPSTSWPPPGEPVPGVTTVAVLAAVAGLAGAAVVVGYRVLAGASTSDTVTLERFFAYQWVGALAAAAALVAAVAAWPRRGAGAALLAGPVAALVVMVGFLALNVAIGGTVDALLVAEFARPAVVLGFYATLLVALPVVLVAEAVRRAGRRSGVPVWLAMGAAVAVVLAAGSAVLASRSDLVSLDVADRAPGDVANPEEVAAQALQTELGDYLGTVVPQVSQIVTAVTAEAQRVLADPTADPQQRADALQERVVAPLAQLTADLEDYPTGAAEVATLHQEVVEALRLQTRRYALVVDNGGVIDQQLLVEAQRLLDEENRHWDRWRELRDELAAQLLAS
jgi:Zn-dependent protease with chaperone function